MGTASGAPSTFSVMVVQRHWHAVHEPHHVEHCQLNAHRVRSHWTIQWMMIIHTVTVWMIHCGMHFLEVGLRGPIHEQSIVKGPRGGTGRPLHFHS